MPAETVKLNPYNFNTNVYSVDRLLIGGVENELGLLIPEFQRDYTWEKEEIKRLFSDLLLGFSQRMRQPSNHFFGATVWNKRTREDETDFLVPSYDIVDGQQRITTCLLLLYTFYYKITETQQQLLEDNSLDQNTLRWLKNEYKFIRERARKIIAGDMEYVENNPYPRIVHEEDRRGEDGFHDYKSPLSKILLRFSQYIDKSDVEIDYEQIESGLQEDQTNVFNRLKDNIFEFKDCLEKIDDEKEFEKLNIPFVTKEYLNRPNFIELFNRAPPDSEFKRCLNNNNKLFDKQIRLIQFFGFFFRATCFTVITCQDTNAAFSIFDSLNTTGVPLTAIETLKPFVITDYNKNNPNSFKRSQAYKNFKEIENSIRAKENNSDKQSKISKEIVIHSLLLGGSKNQFLNNNLTSQRIGLRELHTQCSETGDLDKDLSSTIIAKITRYRDNFCSLPNIRAISESSFLSPEEEDEVKLINAFLHNTGTRLYIPLLTRFYWNSNYRKLYHKACRVITAFYVLRRATTDTTERIDDIFRSCLTQDDEFRGFELNFKNPENLTDDRLNEFKIFLKTKLNSSKFEFNLTNDYKNKWVQKVQGMTHYTSGAKTLLRFMLLVAHDGAKTDTNNNGLIQIDDATPEIATKYLNFNTWDSRTYETLEHVAPQTQTPNSRYGGVYDDPNLKNTIGNFVLLPHWVNSSLQNANWSVKKLFLKVLLQDSHAARKELIQSSKDGIDRLPTKIENSAISQTFEKSNMLLGLDKVEEWNKDFIEKRSKRLCELVWDKMKDWLD